MKKAGLIFMLIAMFFFACDKKNTRTYSAKPEVKAKKAVSAGPTYQQLYTPESVELERIALDRQIDLTTAVKLVANSSKEIKADYLNYLMDVYKTATPPEARLEPMFDAEHLGRFIVWEYVNGNTDSFPEIFSAIAMIFRKGNPDAKFLARYGICQTMIYESRELDVNYNSAFNQWLAGTFKGRWFHLIDEMESGRS